VPYSQVSILTSALGTLWGSEVVGLTWHKDGKKLVLLFEGNMILWIAPARKGEGDEELVVDTDGMLIL